MIIRKLQKGDFFQVLEICRDMREHHRAFLDGYFKKLDDDIELNLLESSAENQNMLSLVAEVDGKIAGLLQAEFRSRPYLEFENFCHICTLGVLPAFRRRGIAKALMAEILGECKKRGISELDLGVFNKNTRAYRLYESLGFQPLEQRMRLTLE